MLHHSLVGITLSVCHYLLVKNVYFLFYKSTICASFLQSPKIVIFISGIGYEIATRIFFSQRNYFSQRIKRKRIFQQYKFVFFVSFVVKIKTYGLFLWWGQMLLLSYKFTKKRLSKIFKIEKNNRQVADKNGLILTNQTPNFVGTMLQRAWKHVTRALETCYNTLKACK